LNLLDTQIFAKVQWQRNCFHRSGKLAESRGSMKSVLRILGRVALAGTLAPFSRSDKWWIRILDFPRPQLLVMGLLAAAGLAAKRGGNMRPLERLEALVVFAACGYQAYRIFPYLPVRRPQVLMSPGLQSPPRSPISLLVANIFMNNRKVDKFLSIVEREQPDIILVVETNDWWENQLRILESEYRYQIKCPFANTYGMLFYSRLELVRWELRFLVEQYVPSVYACVRLPGGELADVYGLHPRTPSAQDTEERDAELLLVGREARHATRPVIVAGDLNDVAWSHTTRLFQRTSGLLDPRIGRGLYNTYHAYLPFLRLPIDHFFHSADFQLLEMKRLERFGSDHFPILIKLDLQPRAVNHQPAPEPNGEDLEEAEEMIQRNR
jgi:endonuclease/exonuclease/phosphatase (EEP) superfamily protein YafD